MKKIGVFLLLLGLCVQTSIVIQGEDGEEDIDTRFPFPQEYGGGIYGSLDGNAKKEEPDIPDIVVPVEPVIPIEPSEPDKPDEPEQPIDPVNPVKPIKPDQPIQPIKPDLPIEPNKPQPPIAPTQIEQANEETNDFKTFAQTPIAKQAPSKAEAGITIMSPVTANSKKDYVYVTNHEVFIDKELLAYAKEQRSNLVLKFFDLNGEVNFMLTFRWQDLEAFKIQDIRFQMPESCEHLSQIGNHKDLIMLLLCNQEKLPLPAIISVKVKENWDEEYGVYLYTYDDEFILKQKGLVIIDGMISFQLEKMKDYVLSDHMLWNDMFDLDEWMSAYRGESIRYKTEYVWITTILGMGSIALSLGSVLQWFRKRNMYKRMY